MLREFFDELHEITGWIFLALAGGPNGANGGEIEVAR